jgi:hypothetical protein
MSIEVFTLLVVPSISWHGPRLTQLQCVAYRKLIIVVEWKMFVICVVGVSKVKEIFRVGRRAWTCCE